MKKDSRNLIIGIIVVVLILLIILFQEPIKKFSTNQKDFPDSQKDITLKLDGRSFKLINEEIYEIDSVTKKPTFIFRAFTIDDLPGKKFTLVDGNIYELNLRARKLSFIDTFYDPEFREKNYVFEDGKALLKDLDSGVLYSTVKNYQDGFEGYNEFQDLFSTADLSKWSTVNLESKDTPTPKESNELFSCILSRECDFIDNKIEISNDIFHSGNKALKTSVLANNIGSSLPYKASILKQNLFFEKNDDFYFSGWYYIENTPNSLTFFDLESEWLISSQGIRILMNNDFLEMELKSFDKPRFRQESGREIPIPLNKWFNVKIHLLLSDEKNGVIEVWQDGVKIIDKTGQTLPLADSVYNRLEVGTSAHSKPLPQTVYVDDIIFSDKPIVDKPSLGVQKKTTPSY